MGSPVSRVDISMLSRGQILGGGGQGKVAEVPGLRIAGQWPAVLKTYSPDILPLLDAAALEAIIRFPGQVDPADRDWLYHSTAWPAVLVEDRGRACGFLMRKVPQEYHFGFRTQTQGTRQKLAELAFLLNPDTYLTGAGLSASDQSRIGLLTWLAQALSRLHALGITVGDLSPKNLLFSLAQVPSCFIIDCDAMRVQGESVLEQIQTPEWEVPAGEASATAAADAYKFGLLAIRLFARDQSSQDPASLAALSTELGRLATQSQLSDPGLRPAPGTWARALQRAAPLVSAAAPPAVAGEGYPPPSPTLPPPGPGMRHSPSARPFRSSRRRRPAAMVPAIAAVAVAAMLLAILIHAAARPAVPAAVASSAPVQGHGSAAAAGTQAASTQAAKVNSLLSQSATSRGTLQSAVNDIGSCTNLPAAVTEIQNVTGQRSAELGNASALQTGALPSGQALKADLISALNYSWRADRDFLRWGKQQLDSGCTEPAPQTNAYREGFNESKLAGQAKAGFLRLWNPIAVQQGLPARSGNFI